jgi:Flp pilus assembly CpaE family ATPase
MNGSPAKKTLTVLLVEDSPEFAALVQQWLAFRTDIDFVLNWTDTLQAGLNRLKNGPVDVILLDLGLPDSSGLDTFIKTKQHAAGVPVILLSGDESQQVALQMVQAGAQDYIAKSSCSAEGLGKAIQYAIARAESLGEKKEDQCSIIGVMGARGGVGCTTIACNLGVELRKQTGQRTLLLDLDLDGGLAGFMMGAESDYTLLDATGNMDRLDASFWDGIVAKCPDGLEILCSPSQIGIAAPPSNDLGYVVSVAQRMYRWIVVDLGRPSPFSLSLLEKMTELFFVTSTSVPALYETRRAIAAMREAGFTGDRLRMVVNQVSSVPEFRGNQLDKLFGVPVYARFPPCAKELHESCIQRKLHERQSPFRSHMTALARKVAGLPPGRPRNMVAQLFSFSEKIAAANPVGKTV